MDACGGGVWEVEMAKAVEGGLRTGRRIRTLGGARGEHEVELGDESQGKAEAGDDGADAVDEPAEGGVVHEVEERHQAQDEACQWLWVG